MIFDIKDYAAQMNNWFEPKLEFEGTAVTEFSSPRGVLGGPARVTFSGSGSADIELEVVDVSIEGGYPGLLMNFLEAEVPERQGEKTTFKKVAAENPCTSITVTTSTGTFTSKRVLAYGYSAGSQKTVMRLHPEDFLFDVSRNVEPRYWVAPLLNFVTDYPRGPRELNKHPLRLRRIADVAGGLSSREQLLAGIKANEENHLLLFEHAGRLVFIEPIPGFHKRDSVESLSSKAQLTAIVVGELGPNSAESISELEKWFPFDLLSALSFATGIEVGIPWLETRGPGGELRSRLHARLGKPQSGKGDPVFHRAHYGPESGIGIFISKFLAADSAIRRALEVPMNLFVSASPGSASVDDNLGFIFRALESLCKRHGMSHQDLEGRLNQRNLLEFKTAVGQAAGRLMELKKENHQVGDPDQYRILEKIQSRLANVGRKEKDFGIAVTELSKKFCFPDADILDTKYIASTYGKSWASMLSEFRGATFHEGYIEFRTKHDIHEAFKILRHLHDLTARIILREIGYSGQYQSSVSRWSGFFDLDWVKPTFTPEQLGF
jgi:hypothetical protein